MENSFNTSLKKNPKGKGHNTGTAGRTYRNITAGGIKMGNVKLSRSTAFAKNRRLS